MSDLGEQKQLLEVRFNKCVKTLPGDGLKYTILALIYSFIYFLFHTELMLINVHEVYKAKLSVSAMWPLIPQPAHCAVDPLARDRDTSQDLNNGSDSRSPVTCLAHVCSDGHSHLFSY